MRPTTSKKTSKKQTQITTRYLGRVTEGPFLWLGLALTALVVLGTIVGGLALKSFVEAHSKDPNAPDINNLPIYPGAYNVTTRDNDSFAVESDDNGTPGPMQTIPIGKITDYQTNAKPEEVLAYYKKAMSERGWPAPTDHSDGNLHFIYASYRRSFPFGGSMQFLSVSVDVKTTGNGVTIVELTTGL